ncbi:hypothetical protein B484DRAFT_394774 [Ochromonadaceae sp. CCMP2298]|nr:hypothetical protein B484DRAFT_394774 [Ochromonadaceae sp. CCMP2298]
MDLTLLSGVVRNRKMTGSASRSHTLFDEPAAETPANPTAIERLGTLLPKALFRKFNLRVHKFSFQWDLVLHLCVCIVSLGPFFFTGKRVFSCIPIAVWVFYNGLFLLSPKLSNLVFPRFGKFKHSFKATIEEFFSPKLLPVLSISFLCVVLSLSVTGHRLGGPPLCYHPCGYCLSTWDNSLPLPPPILGVLDKGVGGMSKISDAFHNLEGVVGRRVDSLEVEGAGGVGGVGGVGIRGGRGEVEEVEVDLYRVGCGYANGKEMLGYYTMAQTSFLLFVIVVIAMAVCLAWRVAEEERGERRLAAEWLKKENPQAFELRSQVIEKFGKPGSSVRPEGSAIWVYYGVTAALTFTLLGWHNWYVLPPSHIATLLIILNLLTILMSTLMLHLSFFGRLLALYKRNYLRVAFLSKLLQETRKEQVDSWWNCRNFVLNDDLSLDYDIGGLAVSATFIITLLLFSMFLSQICREGLPAMLEPPGSYCAYACMYITCCLIKLFTLATNTYEEQHRHIIGLQQLSNSFSAENSLTTDYDGRYKSDKSAPPAGTNEIVEISPSNWMAADDDYLTFREDDGPLLIDEESDSAGVGEGAKEVGEEIVYNRPHLSSIGSVPSPHNFSEALVRGISGGSGGGGGGQRGLSPKKKREEEPGSDVESGSTGAVSAGGSAHDLMYAWFGRSLFSSKGAEASAESGADGRYLLESSRQRTSRASLLAHNPAHTQAHTAPDVESPLLIDTTLGLGAGASPRVSPYASAARDRDYSPTNGARAKGPVGPEVGAGEGPIGGRPVLARAVSHNASVESYRQTIAEIISQIRKYDPYPCIFGIPVMPALFSWCKFYIFIGFTLIGIRTMGACLRQL